MKKELEERDDAVGIPGKLAILRKPGGRSRRSENPRASSPARVESLPSTGSPGQRPHYNSVSMNTSPAVSTGRFKFAT